MNQEANKYLKELDADFDATAEMGTLSVAQQQMVEIARAVSFRSKLVIMDEPTSSLTDRETQLLFDIIRNLKSNGVSVIFITHRLQEILDVCDKVIVMRDGTVEAAGTPDELRASNAYYQMFSKSL